MRIYEPAAYGPLRGCYWAETPVPSWPEAAGRIKADVAIIGGGVTGLNAALVLGEAGRSCVVLEAEHPGWGASGRNGGFCCLGGAKASDTRLRRQFGQTAPADWHATQEAAVSHVAALIDRFGWEVDRHSHGETLLAHNAAAWRKMQRQTDAKLTPAEDLAAEGLGGAWFGAATVEKGFALNPRKYLAGLARAAQDAGATLLAQSPVTGLKRSASGWSLDTPKARVQAAQVLVATNGYSSEDVPGWLCARYLPVQSRVIVTRPLRSEELESQGWRSDQMCYDSRFLLHYFRKLPDNRFLFGMRGGISAGPQKEARLARRIRADFAQLFPAWKDVEIAYDWSGLVCLMPNLVPFAGAVPGAVGLFAALGYHGNGVAIGSYCGALVAARMAGRPAPGPDPDLLQVPPRRFPLGRYRRALLAPVYGWALMWDL